MNNKKYYWYYDDNQSSDFLAKQDIIVDCDVKNTSQIPIFFYLKATLTRKAKNWTIDRDWIDVIQMVDGWFKQEGTLVRQNLKFKKTLTQKQVIKMLFVQLL